MKPTNCVNCGSPLVVCKCKHCGAEYDGGAEYDDSGIHAFFMEDDVFGTLKVCGVEYDVYLESVTCDRAVCDNVFPFGALFTDVKHKFVLREC